MSAMKAYYERMSWHDAGYARQPDERIATAQESICLYRAYNEFGPRLNNCFFTPSLRGADIGHLTAEILETELNAALWDNNFERVAVFKIVDGIKYKIGPIAHDHYAGTDNSSTDSRKRFYQRSWLKPSGRFHQVNIIIPEPKDSEKRKELKDCLVDLKRDFLVEPGNFAREASKRAKGYPQ